MDLNQATQEIVALTLNDLLRNGVAVSFGLAEDLLSTATLFSSSKSSSI